MGYTIPKTEGGSPLPLSGYTIDWPIEYSIGYSIEDLVQKFGYRIQDAIRTNGFGESGLHEDVMRNKLKWWKFRNRDLRKAYMWYTGKIYNDYNILFEYPKHKDSHQTVPASDDSPTLAPEHHEKSAVKKKRKQKIHEHTYELDGGPCLKCGLTVAETIHEDITNYNTVTEKKRKSGKTKVKETLVMDHIKKIK